MPALFIQAVPTEQALPASVQQVVPDILCSVFDRPHPAVLVDPAIDTRVPVIDELDGGRFIAGYHAEYQLSFFLEHRNSLPNSRFIRATRRIIR